jgi:hypothetical protein
MGLRAGLDTEVKRKILFPYRGLNPDRWEGGREVKITRGLLLPVGPVVNNENLIIFVFHGRI